MKLDEAQSWEVQSLPLVAHVLRGPAAAIDWPGGGWSLASIVRMDQDLTWLCRWPRWVLRANVRFCCDRSSPSRRAALWRRLSCNHNRYLPSNCPLMSEEAGSLIWLPGRLWRAVHRGAHAGTISWKRSLLLERQPWLLTVDLVKASLCICLRCVCIL